LNKKELKYYKKKLKLAMFINNLPPTEEMVIREMKLIHFKDTISDRILDL